MKHISILLIVAMLCAAWAEEDASVQHPYFKNSAKALITSNGKKADQSRILAPKFILLYFSAHWCPPCRAFTPELVKFYHENGGGKEFEVLFVSSDEDGEKMIGYMKEMDMPWVGLRFGSSKTNDIQKRYGGPSIPNLVVVNEKDEIVLNSFVDGKRVGPKQVLRQLAEMLPQKIVAP